jgi:hypothetical protein
MYARACRQGYVDAVIDQDPRTRAGGRPDSGLGKIKQMAGRQIALPDLYQVDARGHRTLD